MNRRDRLLRDATAAALEVAVRRGGLPALESALSRFTERQRSALPAGFVEQLQAEAAGRSFSTPAQVNG